jgi:hypothetical protein
METFTRCPVCDGILKPDDYDLYIEDSEIDIFVDCICGHTVSFSVLPQMMKSREKPKC